LFSISIYPVGEILKRVQDDILKKFQIFLARDERKASALGPREEGFKMVFALECPAFFE